MADKNNKAAAKYDPGKTYVVKGDLLNQLLQRALPIKAGRGLKETNSPAGRIISLAGELGVAAGGPCPFGYVFTAGADTLLQGGIVMGGASVEPVTAITLALASADETWLWLAVDFTAVSADGVLLPGVASISSISHSAGLTLADHVLPTMADPSGTLIIPLGFYFTGVFYPLGCGNFLLTHCPGSAAANRTASPS